MERWLLTYADLITLLLAFFVILYALSNTDLIKFLNLRGSLQRAFNLGVLQGQTSSALIDAGELSVEGDIPEISNPKRQPIEAQLEQPSDLEGKAAVQAALQGVYDRAEGIAISLSGSVAFVSGSAELTPEGVAALRAVAEVLQPLPNDLRIEGHTDNLPTGSERYPTNWELSAARAVRIVRGLESLGIPSYRMSAAGWGEQRPLAGNATPVDRAKNRRAEIVILNQTVNILGPPPGATGNANGARTL